MSIDDDLLNQLNDEELLRQTYTNHPELQGLDIEPAEMDYQQKRKRRQRSQNSTPREMIADIRDAMATGVSDPDDPNLVEMGKELDRLDERLTKEEAEAAATATSAVEQKIDDLETADRSPKNGAPSAKTVLKKSTTPMRSRMRAAGQGLAGIAAMAGYGALGGALTGTALGVVGNGVVDGLQGDDIRDGILDTAGTTATLSALGGGYGAAIGRMGTSRGGGASLMGAAVGGTLGLAVSAIKALASDQATPQDLRTINAVAESEGLTPEQLVTGIAAAGLVPLALLPEGKVEVNSTNFSKKVGSTAPTSRKPRRPRRPDF